MPEHQGHAVQLKRDIKVAFFPRGKLLLLNIWPKLTLQWHILTSIWLLFNWFYHIFSYFMLGLWILLFMHWCSFGKCKTVTQMKDKLHLVQSSSEEDGSSGGSSSRNHESYSKYRRRKKNRATDQLSGSGSNPPGSGSNTSGSLKLPSGARGLPRSDSPGKCSPMKHSFIVQLVWHQVNGAAQEVHKQKLLPRSNIVHQI